MSTWRIVRVTAYSPRAQPRGASAAWGSAGAISGPPHLMELEEVNGCPLNPSSRLARGGSPAPLVDGLLGEEPPPFVLDGGDEAIDCHLGHRPLVHGEVSRGFLHVHRVLGQHVALASCAVDQSADASAGTSAAFLSRSISASSA